MNLPFEKRPGVIEIVIETGGGIPRLLNRFRQPARSGWVSVQHGHGNKRSVKCRQHGEP